MKLEKQYEPSNIFQGSDSEVNGCESWSTLTVWMFFQEHIELQHIQVWVSLQFISVEYIYKYELFWENTPFTKFE
jgi:hypothetical protein